MLDVGPTLLCGDDTSPALLGALTGDLFLCFATFTFGLAFCLALGTSASKSLGALPLSAGGSRRTLLLSAAAIAGGRLVHYEVRGLNDLSDSIGVPCKWGQRGRSSVDSGGAKHPAESSSWRRRAALWGARKSLSLEAWRPRAPR